MSNLGERLWYAIYSKPQKEEAAHFHLRKKRVEVFLPKLLLPSNQKHRRRVVPLFPSYLFARIDLHSEEYGYVIWSPGVKRLVSFNDIPVPIDDTVVDFLIKEGNTGGVIPARSNLQIGQEVRIDGGPFDGLAGIIQQPPNAKGRVKVLLSLLNRETKVEVPIRFVNCGWVSSRPAVQA
jgi:transcriptional antiterminator RfaH